MEGKVVLETKTTIKKANSGTSKVGFHFGRVLLYIGLVILAIACFVPFYIMMINATHTNGEITTQLLFLPGSNLYANYMRLKATQDVWRGFANSLIISAGVTILSGYFSALVAYGFSKFKFKGNGFMFWIVLGSMMIPTQLGIIGVFQLCKTLHILDSYWPLILPSIANATSVFFIKGYTDGAISDSLIEAARIDGCSEIRIFNKIVLPLVMPSIATMSIFTFINSWNNFLIPMVLLFDPTKFTLPIMVVSARGVYQNEYGAVFCGVAISIVPIMVAFMFLSKKIVGGLTVGGVKG